MWQTLSRYFVTVPESRNVEASRPDYIKPYLTMLCHRAILNTRKTAAKIRTTWEECLAPYVNLKKRVTLMCDNKQEAKL